MEKKHTLILLFVLLAANISGLAQAAQDEPRYKYGPPFELYFILPVPQQVYFPGRKETAQVAPWGLGFGAIKTWTNVFGFAGLQIQRFSFKDRSLPESNSFYLYEMPLGLEYMSPLIQEMPLHFTASISGDLGMTSYDDIFLAPVVSAGLFYELEPGEVGSSGVSFTFYYRFTEIDLNDLDGRLQPGLGFKIGYAFSGSWYRVE